MRKVSSIFALVGCIALAAACKQSEGETCQIDDDCEEGLECNAGTMRCQKPGANVVDAGGGADSMPRADGATLPDDAGADAATSDAMEADAMAADAMEADAS